HRVRGKDRAVQSFAANARVFRDCEPKGSPSLPRRDRSPVKTTLPSGSCEERRESLEVSACNLVHELYELALSTPAFLFSYVLGCSGVSLNAGESSCFSTWVAPGASDRGIRLLRIGAAPKGGAR